MLAQTSLPEPILHPFPGFCARLLRSSSAPTFLPVLRARRRLRLVRHSDLVGGEAIKRHDRALSPIVGPNFHTPAGDVFFAFFWLLNVLR